LKNEEAAAQPLRDVRNAERKGDVRIETVKENEMSTKFLMTAAAIATIAFGAYVHAEDDVVAVRPGPIYVNAAGEPCREYRTERRKITGETYVETQHACREPIRDVVAQPIGPIVEEDTRSCRMFLFEVGDWAEERRLCRPKIEIK